jgi:hypothetical protein
MLSSASQAFAQGSGQWVDGLFFCSELDTVLIDENNVIKKRIPLVGQAPGSPIAFSNNSYDIGHWWYGDSLFAFEHRREFQADGALFEHVYIAKYQEDEWQYVGELKTDKTDEDNIILNMIPCANDRFIVVSYSHDLWDNDRPDRSPFARASFPAGKTELKIDASIDHGQDDLRPHMADCFELAAVSLGIMTGEYATLVNHSTGLYWIFSLEKASLIKAGNIFRDAKPEWVAKGGLDDNNAILCVRPEIGGTVLVAAQDENFVMTEKNTAEEELRELLRKGVIDANNKEAHEYYERRRKEFMERNPYIVWYRIYPETGKVEKLALPPEGGSLHRDGGKNDDWRPMPDGSVQMGWSERMVKEKSEPDKKADPAEDNKEEKSQSAAPPPKTDAPPPKTDTDAKKTNATAQPLSSVSILP